MSFIQIQPATVKNGKVRKYVHWATSEWNSKKHSSIQRRIYIGILSDDGIMVMISKAFKGRGGDMVRLSEIKSKVESGEDLTAWLEVSGALNLPTNDFPAKVETVGDAYALLSLAEQSGLVELLRKSFGEDLGSALVGLAIHQVAEGRPLYLAGEWLAERELPNAMRGHRVSVAEVYSVMTKVGQDVDAQEQFFRGWIKHCGATDALLCDTTSISTYSENLERAEWGHNRDYDNLPQVNVSLAVTAGGVPVWFRLIPGSVPDVSTLRNSAALLRDLGVGRVGYSLDRGFFSGTNLRDLLEAGDGFVIGIPFSTKRANVLVRKFRVALSSPKRSFMHHGRVLRYMRDAWPVKMNETTCINVDAHVFFDQERRAERVGRFEKAVFSIESKAAKETFLTRREAKIWLSENAGGMARCYHVMENDGKFIISHSPRAVAKATANMGYALIATKELGMPPDNVLTEYRGRDLVEKLFDSLKNDDGQNRLRTSSDINASGRMFLAFVALVLHQIMESRMRESGLLKNCTFAELLAQLRKIKTVWTKSNKRILLEIPKKARDLLSSVKIPLPS